MLSQDAAKSQNIPSKLDPHTTPPPTAAATHPPTHGPRTTPQPTLQRGGEEVREVHAYGRPWSALCHPSFKDRWFSEWEIARQNACSVL